MPILPRIFMVFTNLTPIDLEKEARAGDHGSHNRKAPAPKTVRGMKIDYSREVLTKQYLSVK